MLSPFSFLFFVLITHADDQTPPLHSIQEKALFFSACTSPEAKKILAQQCSKHKNALKLASVVIQRAAEETHVKQAADQIKPLVLEHLNPSIEAREKLLQCLDRQSHECLRRIQVLQKALEQRIHRLRIALGLTQIIKTGQSNFKNLSVFPNIRMPNALGNRALPELSQDERAEVLEFYSKFLRDIDRFQGHDENGNSLSKNKFIELCQSSSSHDCKKYSAYLKVHEEEVAAQAPKAAFAIISAFPILWKFDQSPVSSTDLKKELTESLEILKAWRTEVTDTNSPGKLFAAYPQITNKFLMEHPSLCHEVERSRFDQQFLSQGKEYGRLTLEILATGATCALTEYIGCGLAGFSSAGIEGLLPYKNMQIATNRFSSEGDLEKSLKYKSNLIQSTDVINAQKDLLVGIAFGVAASGPLVHAAAKGIASAADRAMTVTSEVTFDSLHNHMAGLARSDAKQSLAAKVEEIPDFNPEEVGFFLFRDLSENLGR